MENEFGYLDIQDLVLSFGDPLISGSETGGILSSSSDSVLGDRLDAVSLF
jgi:hypothetical protein